MDQEKKENKHQTPDSIDELKKKLYSRTDEPQERSRGELHKDETDVAGDWEHKDDHMAKDKKKTLNKVFWGAVIFFLIAFGYALFTLETGINMISPENISITVEGPDEIDAGEEVEFKVSIRNRNDVEMRSATLVTEFPPGTRNAEDTTRELRRTIRELDTIASGAEASTTVNAVFFGTEGQKQTMAFTVEYRVPDSGATFEKRDTYEVEIVSAPLEFELEAPQEVHAGEAFEMVLEINSNAQNLLSDMLLVADYPSGFEFISSDTDPTFDTNVWLLGDITSEGQRTITVRGRLAGQVNDERAFRFEIGTQSTRNEKVVSTPFATLTHELVLREPLVDMSFEVNGDQGTQHEASPSSDTEVEISWRNNAKGDLEDVVVRAQLNGNVFNPESLSIQNGQYQSGTRTIIWSEETFPELDRIASGQEEVVRFDFVTLTEEQLSRSLTDTEMDIVVTLSGRTSEGQMQTTRTLMIDVPSQ